MCRSKQTPLRRGFLFQGNANELRTVRPDPFHPGVLPRVLWAGVNMKRIFAVLAALLLWHSPVSAEDYYWKCSQVQCTPQPSLKEAALNSARAQGVTDARLATWQF